MPTRSLLDAFSENKPDGSAHIGAVEWYLEDIHTKSSLAKDKGSGGCLCQLQDMIIFDFVSRNSSGCTAGNISGKKIPSEN